ncbi:MAG: hypothetical protein K2P92_02335 [Bdellovibrionaceae bacterium]|nr:hypothetical protein [Pseudobdellovibrionaceae bacterium]
MIQMINTNKLEQQFAVKAVPATVQMCAVSLSDLTAPSPHKVSGAAQETATF